MTDSRNLVVCLDGTNNEPESGATNVARMYDVAEKNDGQLVYYDPGVGTMGSRAAVTQVGLAFSRLAGLAAGYGIGTTSKRPTPGCRARINTATRSTCSDSRAAHTPHAR